MKTIAIILGLIAAGLAFGLYKRNASATAEVATAVTTHQTLSNQVAELRTKLALEQGTSGQTVSNLDYLVKRRDASLAYTSNRLVQANLLLKSAENQARVAQENLQAKTARLAVVEDERDQLAQRLEGRSTLESQINALKAELAEAARAREAVDGEVRQLELEKTELARKLYDLGFLRLQLARAEEDADLKRRLARSGAKASVSSKARLELQADGTVRPLLPGTN
jgi:hypothetical protein